MKSNLQQENYTMSAEQNEMMNKTLNLMSQVATNPDIFKLLKRYREKVIKFLLLLDKECHSGIIHGHPLFFFGTMNDMKREFDDLMVHQNYINNILNYEEMKLEKLANNN